MKFEIRRHGIVIIPENKQDEAYIEDTLGMRKEGDAVLLQRRNAHGLGCMGQLETTIPKKEVQAKEGDIIGFVRWGGKGKPAPVVLDED